MYVVSVIRKDARKRLTLSTEDSSLLSILQIFESTDDVVDYNVAKLDKYFRPIDRYIESRDTTAFSKWKPIPKEDKE